MEFDTEVLDVIQRTHNVKSFRFRLDEEADFRPGQFFFVTIKVGQEEKGKHFSFSNSPTETGYAEFTKRLTDSEFSGALNGLKTGDRARIKMPFGRFTFEGEHAKAAFLTGGIGITPFRSICKYIADKKIKSDIALIYSNRSERDIVFRDDLDEMQSLSSNIKVMYTLTEPEEGKGSWRGKMGRIDEAMVKKEIPDFKDRVFYICGPAAMVEIMKAILRSRLGMPEEKVITENFTGY
ncbi:ferredoxin--NADP reductase [Candidatus Omnitrophota bacterium]